MGWITGPESLGSSLLALRWPEFHRLYLNDSDAAVARALASRVAGQPQDRVLVDSAIATRRSRPRDCFFPGGVRGGTLGPVVVDPTAFQMRFELLARLVVDARLYLIVVFMSSPLKRFIAAPEFEATMDGFFGVPNWRGLVDVRRGGERLTIRHLLDLYEPQLGTLGYRHVDDSARMLNSRHATLYHLVFASKDPKGAEFFQKISGRFALGQGRLFDL